MDPPFSTWSIRSAERSEASLVNSGTNGALNEWFLYEPPLSRQRSSSSQGMTKHKKTAAHKGQPGFLSRLGPGLNTGASDDDPSGIGTYSQAGAQLGFGIGWTML